MESEKVSLLFVCMGNICRSPTAEGVFRDLVLKQGFGASMIIDSAGTHAYHEGEKTDTRAQKAALTRGIDLSDLRARRLTSEDFEIFDYILVMDEKNHRAAVGICSNPSYEKKLHYLLDFAPHLNSHCVPDPYYGGKLGFEQVLDLVEEAAVGLLKVSCSEL